MSWTEITHEHYRRDGLRYATDEERKVISPLLYVASVHSPAARRRNLFLLDWWRTDGARSPRECRW